MNVNPGEFPAEVRRHCTSLKTELGRPVSRPQLAVAILRELDRDYERITCGAFAEVADEWEKHCQTLGRRVVIHVGTRELRGRAESLSEEGALLLRTEHGLLERVIGGDVRLEK